MTTYREFESAIARGTDCDRLIELRNELPIQDKEAAAVQLRRIGCLDVGNKDVSSAARSRL